MDGRKRITKVLVTGSFGFVGSKLAARLKSLGIEVVDFDLKIGRDILDPKSFEDLPKVDVVLHLAARMFIPDAVGNPAQTYKVNINGTLNVLDFCRLRGINHIVYTSSYVYGKPEHLPIREEHPSNTRNPYGRSKVIGEMLCYAYFEDYGIVPTILRPFNIFGPNQDERFLIPTILRQVLEKPEIVVENLSPKRDYVYVDDVVEAYVKSMVRPDCLRPVVYNVGRGVSHSVKDVIDIAQRIAGTSKPVKGKGGSRCDEVPDCVADISRIRADLGWHPGFTLERGLQETLALQTSYVR